MNPDRLPQGMHRVDFEDERTPLCVCEDDLEVSAWIAALCVLVFCVLAVGLGVLCLLGVAR